MQCEKALPRSQRLMPETRETPFSTESVGPQVGISRSVSETNDRLPMHFCV